MAIKDIFDAVTKELADGGVTAACWLGGKWRQANASPPRIVWDVQGGPIGPTESVGGNPRQLRTRNVRVNVLVWGGDAGQAEALLNDFAVAVHRVAVGSYSLENEEWLEESNELLTKGVGIVLSLTFRIPIVDRIVAITPVETAEIAPTFE